MRSTRSRPGKLPTPAVVYKDVHVHVLSFVRRLSSTWSGALLLLMTSVSLYCITPR